jgi:PilZ domain
MMRSFGLSQATGRRIVPRAEVAASAVISMSAGDHPVGLIDISRTGARLHGEFLPRVGQQVEFSADRVNASAQVVWSDTDTCAIEFDTPISISEVQRLKWMGHGQATG